MDGSGKFLPECKRNIPKLSSALGKLLGNGKSYYATAVDQNSIDEVSVTIILTNFIQLYTGHLIC